MTEVLVQGLRLGQMSLASVVFENFIDAHGVIHKDDIGHQTGLISGRRR